MIPIRTWLTWREFMEGVSALLQELDRTMSAADDLCVYDAERLEHLARIIRNALMDRAKQKFEEERTSAP